MLTDPFCKGAFWDAYVPAEFHPDALPHDFVRAAPADVQPRGDVFGGEV
jgi:hypothetical protein